MPRSHHQARCTYSTPQVPSPRPFRLLIPARALSLPHISMRAHTSSAVPCFSCAHLTTAPTYADRRMRLLNRPDEIDDELARYPGPGRWVGVDHDDGDLCLIYERARRTCGPLLKRLLLLRGCPQPPSDLPYRLPCPFLFLSGCGVIFTTEPGEGKRRGVNVDRSSWRACCALLALCRWYSCVMCPLSVASSD